MPGPNSPYSQLDANQCIQQSFDESKDALRVDIGPGVTITVGGQMEVSINHTEDSIRLGDGTNFLTSTTFGGKTALDVNIIDSPEGSSVNDFNDVTSVATSVLTTINTYTVPVGTTGIFKQVAVSGTNIAKYEVLLNGSVIDRAYTYFGAPLSVEFKFNDTTLAAGDIILVRVIHNRPNTGDFNARIQVQEV